jgi:hypothetical protein
MFFFCCVEVCVVDTLTHKWSDWAKCFDLNCTERSYPQVTEEFELSHYRSLEEDKTMFTTFADLEVNFVDGTRVESLSFFPRALFLSLGCLSVQ